MLMKFQYVSYTYDRHNVSIQISSSSTMYFIWGYESSSDSKSNMVKIASDLWSKTQSHTYNKF